LFQVHRDELAVRDFPGRPTAAKKRSRIRVFVCEVFEQFFAGVLGSEQQVNSERLIDLPVEENPGQQQG